MFLVITWYELNIQKKLIEATKDIFDEVITQQNYNVVHRIIERLNEFIHGNVDHCLAMVYVQYY